jgi:succinate dehydrogenase / fumarate reductase cytochrome b subunit
MLFILVHLIDNLLIFAGQDALNAFARGLRDWPGVLWVFRGGLLLLFAVHIFVAIRLSVLNTLARPVRYQYEDTRVASLASRTMLTTGLVVLAFLLYHLAHFTFGWTQEAQINGRTTNFMALEQSYDPITRNGVAEGTTHTVGGLRPAQRHDAYTMVIVGFRNPLIAGLYILAQVALWFHLCHGASSWAQTVGWGTVQENKFLAWGAPTFATIILVGNCTIVLAVFLRLIGTGVPES